MLKVVSTMSEEQVDEYEAARQSYTDIRQRLTEIKAEIARLEAARWAANGGDDLDAAAEAYLDGVPASSFEPELKRLGAEREVVERAVGIARNRFGAAREARHNELTKSLRPAHRQAAARVVECLIQLAEANAQEAHIRQQAPGGGLPFLSFPNVDLGRQDTAAKHFLAYLKRIYGIEPAPRTEAAE